MKRLLPLHAALVLLAFVPSGRSFGATETFAQRLVEGARREAAARVLYDPSDFHMPYPRGDVPADIGACTDLVVRAFRWAGIDLQEEIHKDRLASPSLYPSNDQGESNPDPSLDHRRCRHLAVWFRRHALELTTSAAPEDLDQWQPGDVVFFNLSDKPKERPDHVAIVSDRRLPGGMPFVIDNFPPGAAERFALVSFPVIHSHFRWPAQEPGQPIEPRYVAATPHPWRARVPASLQASPTPVPLERPSAARPSPSSRPIPLIRAQPIQKRRPVPETAI